MPGTRFSDVRRFDELDSTNRYLLDEARAGAAEGVVAVAQHQRSGRGRLGRSWVAPAGANLLMSVLLRPGVPAEERYLVGAVVALAGLDAAATTTGVALRLKWPNDLIAADGRKVAGVLAEADLATTSTPVRRTGAGPALRPPIVVGIGINANWPAGEADLPEELVGHAASLQQLAGGPVDLDVLLDALLDALEPRVSDLATRAGRTRQADAVRSCCATLGRRVVVDLPDGRLVGDAVELTGEGHLVVDVGGERRTVVAGDVIHLRGAPGGPSGHR